MSKLIIVFLTLFSWPVIALEEMNQRPELEVGTLLGSLILVLACIFLFAFLMKKGNFIRHGGYKNPIKVIATQALTNKSRVQIIEVHGKQYLLGVSEQSVNLLDQLASPIAHIEVEGNEQITPSLTTALASVLSKAWRKSNE